MAKWMVSAKKADFAGIAQRYHISPVTARIIRNRDVILDEEIDAYLNGDRKALHDPAYLPEIDSACALLADAISEGKKIRVIGDYDVDGVCATVTMLRGLAALGADVDYDIPHRIADGYGINRRIIDRAKEDGKDLLVTVDNGVAALDEADYAASCGLRLIVTDHHMPGAVLPHAQAVVDPCRTDVSLRYPYPPICGAVVAWKCLLALASRMGEEAVTLLDGMEEMLTELSALATVCDVMPLKDENRIIVREGLATMHQTHLTGLKALMDVNGLGGRTLTTYHLGFVIGPCLNAGGRLDSAKRSVRLLMCDDYAQAVHLASELKELNDSRKQMTALCVERAKEICGDEKTLTDRVLVIYLPDAHESVAGIVAGRIREAYARPAIILTDAEDGIKGSARSIPPYDIHKALTECKDLFAKFGGHKMAAGMTLQSDVTPDMLRQRLNDACALTDDDLIPVLHLDMELPPAYATVPLIREWACLAPFGTGNERPHFAARDLSFLRGRVLGKEGSVGKYTVCDAQAKTYELMLFQGLDAWHAHLEERFGADKRKALYAAGLRQGEMTLSVAYYPDINEFRGQQSVQLVMEDYQ